MAQIKKVESQVELNCNADKLFDVWARRALQVAEMCSAISKVELVDGDNCDNPNSILSWTFINPMSGKQDCLKTLLEEIDEKKRSLTYQVIEGEVMDKHYKLWRETVQFISKAENCTVVDWTVIEYQKKHQNAPDLKLYIDFCLHCIEDIARHLPSP